jgi:hypothetical protein
MQRRGVYFAGFSDCFIGADISYGSVFRALSPARL